MTDPKPGDVLKMAQELEEAAAHLQVDGHYIGAASCCRRAARMLYDVAKGLPPKEPNP